MPSNLKQDVEEAIKDMVTVDHFDKGLGMYKSVVSLPLTYPSGASVCIEVREGAEEHFLLFDMGNGLEQVRNSNGDARVFAEVGVNELGGDACAYRTGELGLLTQKSKLQGAIITVANASMKAVDRAINWKG